MGTARSWTFYEQKQHYLTSCSSCDLILPFGSPTMTIDVFVQHFADVKDPCQTAKISYPLYDVLFLSICAIFKVCEGWRILKTSVKPD